MTKLMIISLFCAIVLVCANAQDEGLCELKGGTCATKGSCTNYVSAEYQGYCNNKNQECCNKESDPKNRCMTYGGQCDTNCPPTIIDTRGKDCATGRKCCAYRT